METGDGALLRRWHPEKNKPLTPKTLPFGSKRKIWWRCELGHEWQARCAGRYGCPVCAGKVVLPGFNDLAGQYPELSAQWHPDLNGDLTPANVTPNSNRKVWWRCEAGHAWQAVIAKRVRSGSGCPYCANTKVLVGFNDLETRHPEVAAQWHPDLNGELTAQMVTPGSHRKVWWQCAEGHVWKAAVYSRTDSRKCGCPVCAGRTKSQI